MKLSAAEVDEILDLMSAGASVTIGGSRCNTTYTCRDGAWVAEHFDEGSGHTSPTSRGSVREMIRHYPNEFVAVLKTPRWARFSEAFLAGDAGAALERLPAATRYGDNFRYGDLLEAFLWFPTRSPSPEIQERIRSELSGYTAYHVFMNAAQWDRSPETGRKGVAFVDRLIAMAGGPCEGCYKVRASFHQQAGDLAAAIADLERELAFPTLSEWTRNYVSKLLAQVNAEAAEA